MGNSLIRLTPMLRSARGPRSLRRMCGAEPLESRLVMATFNVNSFADVLSPPAGTVTLRSAIQAANSTLGPSTIDLSVAGTYKITTLGSSTDNSAGELAIAGAGNLTIANTSGGAVTIDGSRPGSRSRRRPSATSEAFTVTLRGLVITGGSANSGGGIRVQGGTGLVLDHTIVSGNVSSGDGGGIAVLAGSTGAVTLAASQVTSDRALGYGGAIADAGSGLLTIGSQSLISGNASQFDGGGIALSGAPLAATGAVISDNSAVAGHGGGVDERGAELASFSGCLVENNVA